VASFPGEHGCWMVATTSRESIAAGSANDCSHALEPARRLLQHHKDFGASGMWDALVHPR